MSDATDRPADAPPHAAADPRWQKRLLPRPWTALWVWLAWLLLNQTVATAHVLLGALLGLVLARLPGGAPPPVPATPSPDPLVRRAKIAARLTAVVLRDIVVANLQVAARILGPQQRLKPRFVWIPLDVTRPHSITLLAGIITMTPGTLSVELDDDHGWLMVHGLDIDDAEALVDDIKTRYEAPIKELFE